MILRALAAFVALVASAACANPSPLDRTSPAGNDPTQAADATAWREIAARARPLDTGGELLDIALTATSLAERLAALETWAAAGGRIARVPPRRAFGAGDLPVAIGKLGLDAAAAAATDDRALQAALYTAQRLRRDGDDLVSATVAVAIIRKVIQVRPHAPAFAASFAPTDAEVVRGFAAEAMAVTRLRAWAETPDAARVPARDGKSYRDFAAGGDPLAAWTWLATAPEDRAGFTAAIAKHADADPALARYAQILFDDVDAYRRWMATGN